MPRSSIENNQQQLPLKARLIEKARPGDPERAASIWDEFCKNQSESENAKNFDADLAAHPALPKLLKAIFGNSPYLTGLITRHPEVYQIAINAIPETHMSDLANDLRRRAKEAATIPEIMTLLRHFKKQAALFIALADIGEVWDVTEVVKAVTFTADTSLNCALDFLFRDATNKGEYLPPDPEHPQKGSGYIVLAMGKHGAFELNYSSDIDLIVFYDKQIIPLNETIEPGPYLVRLTQKLIKIMQEITADGYVFRMDLRLRPDPGATQIALSTEAAFAYYESFGQNWERAAMIKARPAAGDIAAGVAFLEELAPYIWRKYLDYAAIDDIHAMKRQIHNFKGHGSIKINGHDLKLGRGGIREIEFFVQTQQLIAGGRQPELRTRQTLTTLKLLAEQHWIKPEVCQDLSLAYKYLRRLEHRVQMLHDEQTHKLPQDPEVLERFAKFCGYPDLKNFGEELIRQLKTVQRHYEDLFEEDVSLAGQCGNLVFVGDNPDPGTIETLTRLGFKAPEAAIDMVKTWHYGRYAATRSSKARERLTEFQPILLEAIAKTSQPDKALATFDTFLKDLPAGVQLFSLLSSNPNLLRLIADIMGTAPSLARILSRRTRLLDAVLDPAFFGDLPDEAQLHEIITEEFARCEDYQDTLDRARVIGQEQKFLTGVRLLSGMLDASSAARNYTRIAETVIDELQLKVLRELEAQHGTFEGSGVSVLAMGKLGGREMTALSDLDLILIYDFDPGQTQSNGPKPLSPTQYYSRVTQRLISALSAPTAEGELFEVDMRLRPSGRAGPVATHIDSFIEYQRNQAWVWEHMALTRARPITGPAPLKAKLCMIISDILSKPRDTLKLARDVDEMRGKIKEQKGTSDLWDIKQITGGQVDLEFICQYLQLRDGHRHKSILETNTEESFRAMQKAGNINEATSATLIEAAIIYNTLIQLIRLCIEQGFDPETASEGLKSLLAESLSLPSFSSLTETIKIKQNEINELYGRIILSD